MKITNNLTNLVRRVSAPVLSFVLVLFAALTAYSLPADLDSGFGAGGTVLTEFDGNSAAQVVLVQPDGKIIAGGQVVYPGANPNLDFVLARYNPDGTLDSTFGANGKTVTPTVIRERASTGALQADGKILIAGSAGDFALTRYNSDGTLDASFGDGGKIITAFGTAVSSEIRSLLVQPDGKIVAVGDSGDSRIYLVRYNADGTLDASFGSGGKVTTVYADAHLHGRSALLQPDGKIVVGGDFSTGDDSANSALFRYNPDGTPDTSFDGDGLAFHSFSPSHDRVSAVLLRPDGKLLFVGTTVNQAENKMDYALGVYNANGTPDVSFGAQGFKILSSTGMIGLNSAILQPDGKIVAAGTKLDRFGSRGRFHVVRFNADGSFDQTFGNDGRFGLSVGNASAGYSLAIQPDGKLLAAGSGMALGTGRTQFAINRLQGGNGPVPTTAAITGRVVDDFNNFGDRSVGGVTIILTGGNLSEPRYARTNPFGFYRFTDLPVGAVYTMAVIAKRPAAYTSPLSIFLNGNENADEIIYRLD